MGAAFVMLLSNENILFHLLSPRPEGSLIINFTLVLLDSFSPQTRFPPEGIELQSVHCWYKIKLIEGVMLL